MENYKAFIDKWIEEHQSELIADLAELVAIPSELGEALDGAPFGKAPHDALMKAVEICEKLGFKTRVYDNRAATAVTSDLEPGLDMLGHMDVVTVGEGWETDPYTLTEKDGLIYGRGVADDKGPSLAAIYAMKAVMLSGAPLKKSARMIIGSNEETGMQDLPAFYKAEDTVTAPYTFSPDSAFPVYNVEKGFFRPVMSGKWEKQSVTPRVSFAQAGDAVNVVPAYAEAVVCGAKADDIRALCEAEASKMGIEVTVSDHDDGAKVETFGVSSHAAYPEASKNALTALFGVLAALPLADCPSTRVFRSLAKLFPYGDCYGAGLGVAQEDELSGKLTLMFDFFRLNEEGYEGIADSRVPVCANKENCADVAMKNFEAEGIEAKCSMSPAHHTPAESHFVKTLLSCYEEVTGLEGKCCYMGGGTYVHNIEGGVAFGAEMPGFDSKKHSIGECMAISDLIAAAKIYARSILELCI